MSDENLSYVISVNDMSMIPDAFQYEIDDMLFINLYGYKFVNIDNNWFSTNSVEDEGLTALMEEIGVPYQVLPRDPIMEIEPEILEDESMDECPAHYISKEEKLAEQLVDLRLRGVLND